MWGIKSKSGPGGKTKNGVHIEIKKHVYVDLGGAKPNVYRPGSYPPPGKVNQTFNIQYMTIINAVQVLSELAPDIKSEQTKAAKVSLDDVCDQDQETFILFDSRQYRLTGGDFEIVGDSSSGDGKFIYATGGVEELFGLQRFKHRRYFVCGEPQVIVVHHVNKHGNAGGMLGDPDDPACWVVIGGVSTYVCGCG